ncbi:glycosyl-4,4'-diaponeurosporenoate acyltransferase CrtO family protein [Hymenobacter jeollabukensis]|uniref:Glycosyl-4,4'-diaponeurosporenoate acyltransferase n=1 Tax=Hymenobacter jeollabukensis TaxID=2025313 RepID=A0A5R8WI05_9BACT|nr:hypothetical protein [Hymenobacter jeollabukensis]TLM87881.1 hypothetical protein FDY95_24885 [Hymenobacter jeollabukensis]
MSTERQQARRRAGWYNAVPNVLWSVLGLGPVAWFAYAHVGRPWLWGMVAVSLLAYLLPARALERLRLSASPARYRRLGVHWLNRVTQNGELVNRQLRRRFPGFRQVPGRAAAERHLRASYHLERFHLALLVFFVLVGAYAAACGQWGWALLILVLNVGYNLYPMWLQQYLRSRLRAALRPGR